MSSDEFVKINFADALSRLPGPQKEASVSLFEHGSLVAKLYAPAGNDSQRLHSRDEIYVMLAARVTSFKAEPASHWR